MNAIESNKAEVAGNLFCVASQTSAAVRQLLIPARKRHFHVGLSGANPDFANDDVLQNDFVFAGNDQIGSSVESGHSLKFDQPLTVFTGGGLNFLTIELDGYVFASVGVAPNFDGNVPLQNGVVSKRFCQSDVCIRRRCKQTSRNGNRHYGNLKEGNSFHGYKLE